MNAMQEQTSIRTNVHQRTLQARSKPGRRCRQEFCESETPEENFLNKKILNFDWSDFLNEKSMAACLSSGSDHFDRPVLSEILEISMSTHISLKSSDLGDYILTMPVI